MCLGLAVERSWACSHKAGKSLEHTVYRVSLAASLYWIWRERNFLSFFFQNKSRDVRGLINQMEEDVRACMVSWKSIKKSDSNRLLAIRSRVPFRIFAA